ncbi:MAG: Klebsiella phage Sugarl [Actinomycetota bacterium]
MPITTQELRDQRAAQLNIIDDIIRTAKEAGRGLTDDERARHDAAVAAVEGPDGLDAQIVRSEQSEGDIVRFEQAEVRRGRYAAPNVNLGHSEAVRGDHNLDALLWATSDDVAAGSYDKAGNFRQHSVARNAVEQIVVRNDDGYAVHAPRIAAFRPEDRSVVRNFQKTVADMALFGLMIDRSAKTSKDGFEVARNHKAMKSRWQEICRALDVDTSGEGGTWVPTGIGANLHEKVRAAGKVSALFSRIDLPTNPWKWPIEGSDATAYRVAEPTGDTETKITVSTPGTVAATFDAEIFGARTLFSRSLEADSALAILPFVQMKLVRAFVDAEEKAILDGDTDGTHQDSDIGASTTAAVTAWDGLRKRALANASVATTSTSVANLLSIRALMGKWGVNPQDVAFIVGVSAYHDLIADTNFLTVDKMGPNATILNGQVGALGGAPVVVSEWVREALNASGVYDGITTTKTYNLCVNRNEWVMGQRMALDIEVDDSIYRETYQRVMVGFMREDFQNIGDASGNDDTAIGYNVTP